jgi:hypothetical protein
MENLPHPNLCSFAGLEREGGGRRRDRQGSSIYREEDPDYYVVTLLTAQLSMRGTTGMDTAALLLDLSISAQEQLMSASPGTCTTKDALKALFAGIVEKLGEGAEQGISGEAFCDILCVTPQVFNYRH